MEFTSQNFDEFSQLVNEKNNLVLDYCTRNDREETVSLFYNGQPTMSDEEAEAAGREEITNHLFGYKSQIKNENKIYRIYSGPGNLVDIKIDTGNPEQDVLDSVEMSKAASKAIRFSGVFSNLWRSVSGDMNLRGKAPIMFDGPTGWCPVFVPNILLPKGSPLAASEIPYAFVPREMTMAQLERLKEKSAKNGGAINGEAVTTLIEALKNQIIGNVKNEGGSDPKGGFQHNNGATDDEVNKSRKTTMNVWWYYEPREEEGGNIVVDGTLFTEAISGEGKDSDLEAQVIGHIPALHKSPEAWLHLMALDSQIGGAKTYDTTKGMAELTYPSDLDAEELVNSMMEGDKSRALPRVQRDGETGNEDEILAWNANEDSLVPEGLKEFRMTGTSQNLLTPIGILLNNSAGISDGNHSNVGRDQQLRQQAVRSGQVADESQSLRMEDAYLLADPVFAEIVFRLCNSSVEGNVRGKADILWFREQMDMQGIDYKTLSMKSHGRSKYLTVKARRLAGNGMREEEAAVASQMLEMRGSFPPEMRPRLLQRAVATLTQDADFAEEIVPITKMIVNDQKTIAENEYDTIRRRAALNITLPTNPTDIDQDHLPVHLLDLEAHLMRHEIEPWKRWDLITYAQVQKHAELHLQRMMADPVSSKEANEFAARLSKLAAAGDKLAADLDKQEQEQQNGMSPKEQADYQLKAQEQQRKDNEFQLRAVDQQGTEQQRQSRTEIAERNQQLKEGLAVHKVRKDNNEEFRKDQQARSDALSKFTQ